MSARRQTERRRSIGRPRCTVYRNGGENGAGQPSDCVSGERPTAACAGGERRPRCLPAILQCRPAATDERWFTVDGRCITVTELATFNRHSNLLQQQTELRSETVTTTSSRNGQRYSTRTTSCSQTSFPSREGVREGGRTSGQTDGCRVVRSTVFVPLNGIANLINDRQRNPSVDRHHFSSSPTHQPNLDELRQAPFRPPLLPGITADTVN